MTEIEKILTREEMAGLKLRALYYDAGYTQYRMSKFEEYDLYVRNKDFLVSDSIITFTDTDGRLRALKPDVTLSIIKNTRDTEGLTKLYYNENVYRVSKGTHTFREIMQTGVECIGEVDKSTLVEVLTLAIKSLETISPDCVLEISDTDIVSGIISHLGVSEHARAGILECLGEKNVIGARSVLEAEGVGKEGIDMLIGLLSLHGSPEEVIPKLSAFALDEDTARAVGELTAILDELARLGLSDKTAIDFSVINNTRYYNGIAFRGFLLGVPTAVLLGGRYDKLMSRMKRTSGAVGFAVYLDEISRLGGQ